jgi:hypothetical protein
MLCGKTDYSFRFVNILDQSFKDVNLKNESAEKSFINSEMYQDSQGNLWYSSHSRLYKYNPGTLEKIDLSYILNKEEENGILINSFLELSPSTYYISIFSGLYRLEITPQVFQEITIRDVNLSDQGNLLSVRSLHVEQEHLYIGSYVGFFDFNLTDRSVGEYKIFDSKKDIYVKPFAYQIIKVGNNELLLASETGGVQKYTFKDDEIFHYLPESELKFGVDDNFPFRLFSILKMNERILVGGKKGLYQIIGNQSKRIITSYESFNNAFIYSLCQHNDRIFAGTTIGLFEIVDDDVQPIELISSQLINVNYIYGEGHELWIGTRGSGLIKYDLENEEITRFSHEQGLLDPTVNAIIRGNDNGLWFSTNYGIARLKEAENSIRHFFIDNELPFSEFNHNAISSDKEGNLFFGGVGGIVYFNPRDMSEVIDTAHLILSQISRRNAEKGIIEYETFDIDDKGIHLGPNDEYFSVRFAKSNLKYSDGDQYSYRLNGKDWINIGNNKVIQIIGLNPGSYNLEIKRMAKFMMDNNTLSIPIIIDQVFY